MALARFCLLIFTLPACNLLLHAQNLVPNGSFEDYQSCPGGYTQHPAEFRVPSWRSLTLGSPDYFNSCSEGDAAVPYNWAGVSDAYEGFGYAGIYTWLALKDYREYLHCRLIEPLIKDSLYRIEFRYKLSSYSKYATDRIGVLLSDSLGSRNDDKPLKVPPTISFVKDSALTPETGAWELAQTLYRANGDERFLTIGNFADNVSTRCYHIRFRPESEPMLAAAAYYYIDDVSIVPQFRQPEAPAEIPVFSGGDAELEKVYVLRNIQFEFNSYALLPESYFDLDNVITYLREHSAISVELSGHTDDVGDALYNEVLSLNRAKAAAAYLISKGILASRISAVGRGESLPVVHDTSEEARNINRRVEIKFFR